MIAKSIVYFGKPCILACDANCKKAWGINNRPLIYLEDPTLKVYGEGFTDRRYPDDESLNPDDYVHLADGELGDAPDDPGTYEGGHAKPTSPEERLNKWCARECERQVIVDDNEDFELPDYSKRQYNCAPHTREG